MWCLEMHRIPGVARLPMRTFAERFCARYGVPPEGYAGRVFQLTLYRRTRPLVWLLRLIDPDYFACDYTFIRGVGRLKGLDDLLDEIRYYCGLPGNRGFLRRALRLRVSAARIAGLVETVMNDGQQPSLSGEKGMAELSQ